MDIAAAGRTIGQFAILQKLGRGGMADVYLAKNLKAKRQVALKLIEFSTNPEIQEFIEVEQKSALLQKRVGEIGAAPKIYSYGETDGHFFIEMEYVPGNDLAEILREGSLPTASAVDIALQVSDLLARTHSLEIKLGGRNYRGIVHGDIKPANIRVDAGGKVRILDFGIAKALSYSRKFTRNAFGSVSYSSPERLETGVFDKHSDLWSLGVVLYEMLSGRPPFEGSSTTLLEKAIRSRSSPSPLPRDCPPPLRSIVTKALAPDLNKRYQSAATFKSDLQAFARGEEPQAYAEMLGRAAPAERGSAGAQTTRRTPQHGFFAALGLRGLTTPALVERKKTAPATEGRRHDSPLRRRLWRINRTAGALAMIYFLMALSFANEIAVWKRAGELSEALNEGSIHPDAGWAAYRSLQRRSFLGVGTLAARNALKEELLLEGDRLLTQRAGLRDPSLVRAADYYYSHALQVNPLDRGSFERLQYTRNRLRKIGAGAANASASAEADDSPSFLRKETQPAVPQDVAPQSGEPVERITVPYRDFMSEKFWRGHEGKKLSQRLKKMEKHHGKKEDRH